MTDLRIGQSCGDGPCNIISVDTYLPNTYTWMVFDLEACLPLFCLDGGATPLENVALLTN